VIELSTKKELLMQPIVEEPPCPRCGNSFSIRLFTAGYAAKLATDPPPGVFNLFDMVRGVTLHATKAFQKHKEAQDEIPPEQQIATIRDGYQAILEQCPPLYTYLTDQLVFIQGAEQTVSVAKMLRALDKESDAEALMKILAD
jgi:hypothetical protein